MKLLLRIIIMLVLVLIIMMLVLVLVLVIYMSGWCWRTIVFVIESSVSPVNLLIWIVNLLEIGLTVILLLV
jgi:hypothetical protein